ncbi:MAG TPA: hypothetical protein VLB68_21175, partial [Pyrinomonadaceae bacterium]|nr:hypothetical protein [Pyrinomonadaceae bacterium]
MEDKRPDADHEHSSIPTWIKSAGAIVGIVAALSGAVAGAYQVLSSLKQFQLQIAKEGRATAEARARQAAEENSRAETEARTREDLKKKDFELKQTEFLTEAEKRKALELTITREREAQEASEKSKIAAEVRTNQRQDEQQLSDNIRAIFEKPNSAPALATLSRHAKPEDENLSTILTPLVAKLDDVIMPAEVNIIFQLFNKSGPSALNAVLDANRIAFEKYKRDIRELARLEFAAELKRRSESSNTPATNRYEIQRAVSQRIVSAYVGNPGLVRLADQIVVEVSYGASLSAGGPMTEDWE